MKLPEEMARMILENGVCALATCAGGQPRASLMSYAVEADCSTIYLATPASTRKWANLRANPEASLLIDERCQARERSPAPVRALTLDCVLEPVDSPEARRDILARIAARHPHLADFLAAPDMEPLRLRPRRALLLRGASESLFVDLEK